MLTQAQVDQLHRDGFLVIRNVFGGEELAALRRAADAVVQEGMAGQGQHHLYYDLPGGVKRYFRSEQMWERDPIFAAATVHPGLLAMIGQCIGEPFLPINDSFVCKTPHSEVPIHWHQDPPCSDPQFDHTHPVPNFDTDIYLDHSTIANGCVWGIPGHHLVGHVDLRPYTQEQLFHDFGAVPLEMAPGDVLFHCLSAPHGSIANRTATTRRIFYVHYMARDILHECYGKWLPQDPRRRDWNDAWFARVQGMVETRRQLGLGADLAAAQVAWQPGQGFDFTGQPKTPRRHWGELIARISPAERAALKRLPRPAVA
jgi:ectoine hydroxylase-related dioxygenase (phytanoyl-CoA dioxygenase family)